MDHYLDRRASRPAASLIVDRSGHTIIQSAQMVQATSGEDVALLLSLAQHAIQSGDEAAEDLELSHGRVHAHTRLVLDAGEAIGAVVSLGRARRRRIRAPAMSPDAWEPMVGRSPAMQRLFRDAARVCSGRPPVAIWERAGTIVLRRVQALGPAAQLALCDHLDALADGEGAWVLALLGLSAPEPCTELLSRLAHVSLTVAPLRDRGHDLRLLIDRWCDERERATGTRPTLRADAHEALAARSWPGNVRELHNTLDAAALRAGTVIGVESLDLGTRGHPAPPGAGGMAARSLRELEHDAIDAALRRSGGNVSRAARELGIGRATLHRRLRAYRLLP